tara:strand:- start:942 stop:1517 length:576 start_codon:yes stop_codon:yes gene_type:complete
MAENSVAPVARGESFFKGGTADADGGKHLEGMVHHFPDTDPADTTKRRSGGNVVAILVRNGTGGAVLPGRVYTWTASKAGTTVGALAGADAYVAGVADDHLPSAGAASNDLFWLIVKGNCHILLDAAVAAGAVLYAVANGEVATRAESSALTTHLNQNIVARADTAVSGGSYPRFDTDDAHVNLLINSPFV